MDEVELTSADEVWNSVQYSCYKFCVDGVKLMQMGGGTLYNIKFCYVVCRSNMCISDQTCISGVEHSKIFICYVACADEVNHVQIRSGT